MNNNLKPIETITPFKRFCMTIGELPTSYLESMTYYEMLVWFTKYLQETVIPAINNNGEAVNELQTKYIELKNYVDNYFDNLDVQEEINNKLDDMVEQGTLQEIITDYLNTQAIFCYDNVDGLKQATNLINGSYAKTLGYYNKNDRGGSLFKIRTKTLSDVEDNGSLIFLNDNTLLAELILYNEISIKQFGAKGDNSTNDTSKIQACINYAQTNSLIKTVYIPVGTYLISQLEITSTINLKGENIYYSELKSISDNTSVNSLLHIVNSGSFNTELSNFRINGNKENNSLSTFYGILGTISQSNLGDRYTNLNNLNVTNCNNHGILFDDNLTNYDFREIRLDNIEVYNCKKGIYAKGVTDSIFSRITCHNNLEEGIYIASSNNRIINCKCFFNGRGDETTIEDIKRIPSSAFSVTQDETMQPGKTYYTRSGKNYQNSYYKFTQTTDESFQPDVTYYELTTNYYKRYAGIVINGSRNTIVECECQDNFGDGIQVLKSFNAINNVDCDNNGIYIPSGQVSAGTNIVSYASQNLTPLYVGIYIYGQTETIVTGTFNNHRYNAVGVCQYAPIKIENASVLGGSIICTQQGLDDVMCQNADLKRINISINGITFKYVLDISNIVTRTGVTVYVNVPNGTNIFIQDGICYYNIVLDGADNKIFNDDYSNRNLINLPSPARPKIFLNLIPKFSGNHAYDCVLEDAVSVNLPVNGELQLRGTPSRNYKSVVLNGSFEIADN